MHVPRVSRFSYLALAAILLLALFLHFFRLDQEGFANLYYAATVKSMLTSWHNFFYASFDPGGFVSVDKPPLGLWVQALSATILGFNGFALLLPQALAGVLSVVLLYHLVARIFGAWAGVIAALVLTVTPINIAANRNNTMDSQLVFTSLLAAWAVSIAAERGKLRWLLVCAILVGIGFNIKMLQAYMVLPAFWLTYLIAARTRWYWRIAHLVIATIVLVVISFAWIAVFDATPADKRPYAGSSHNNTMLELVVGHNGLARLGQIANWLGLRGPTPARPPIQNPQPGNTLQRPLYSPSAPTEYPPANSPGQRPPNPLLPQPGRLPAQPPQNPVGQPPMNPPVYPPANPPGPQPTAPNQNSETGNPGVFRLFNQQLVGQASWLLPLALFSILVLATELLFTFYASRFDVQGLRFEVQNFAPHTSRLKLHAFLLWSIWLIPQLVFFSFAGLFHRYYLEMMSPAIAALVGAGLVSLWNVYRHHKWRGLVLPISLIGTAVTQAVMLTNFPDWSRWLTPLILGLTAISVIALLAARSKPTLACLPFAVSVFTLLIAPTLWAFTPVVSVGDSGLPFAGPELLARRGGGNIIQTTNPLIDYLRRHRNGAAFLVATLNAQTASPIILATGEPVMAMGGFGGNDNILTTTQLAQYVADNTVRFFWLPQGSHQQIELIRWVQQNCSIVNLAPQRPGQNNPPPQPGNTVQQLYHCAK